jgi:C4-dicarboxylate-specific signal transduction histidine kinase
MSDHDILRIIFGLHARMTNTEIEPMNRKPSDPPTATSTVLPAATALLAGGIFALDTVTNLEIAVAVLYVAVVLLSVGFCRKRGVVLVSLGCMALTMLSYLFSNNGSHLAGLVNSGMSILAIAATTFLALRIESAELAAGEARAQLAHISRVTMLGELTASIAHEVNQPLTATLINGNACLSWLGAQPPNLEEATRALERIISDSARASDVIARVRGLFKKSALQRERVNINDIVRDTVALTRIEIEKNRVAVKLQLADNLPLVWGDRIQLQQVVLNFVLNAVEAMNDAGGSSPKLLVVSTRQEMQNVLVAVHDSGRGLDPAKISRLFDAFYTTKQDGLGMGLAISRSIIEAHGGKIWAEANNPRGAVFRFLLSGMTAEVS